MSPLSTQFSSLSLQDVLEARDAYHVHLIQQPNVVGTAVGRYLARDDEDPSLPQTPAERLKLAPGSQDPRTLERSRVQRWSWPCVLVFVKHWMSEREIRKNPDGMVPRTLYLPSGKKVPTCVIYSPPAAAEPPPQEHLSFPSDQPGGGYVCISEVQGSTRIGSIACLVTDGDLTYALTNRHVAGEAGRVISTVVAGSPTRLGASAGKAVGRLPFEQVYPGLPGKRSEVALDAGLIEIDEIDSWTTQIFGLGRLDSVLDVGPESLSLSILGKPVRAFGSASGDLRGEVLALFYRYETRDGIEYVADVLVGPRDERPLLTRPGDSGTLWVLDPGDADPSHPPALTAVAMEWGGERLKRPGAPSSPYALATFASNVCRALDVEVVTDWNADHKLYWGQVGHYTIGAAACDLVQPAQLRSFFQANRENISFELADIEAGKFKTPEGTIFYPLADVPDLVWKLLKGHIRAHEKPNHFADMDDDSTGESLLSLYRGDPSTVNAARWLQYYQALKSTPSNMGLLPFRVAQLYEVALDSLRKGGPEALAGALCATGAMAHYVGDACQPLHVSRFHDGRDESEKGVHEAYETKMVGAHRGEIIAGLTKALAKAKPMPEVAGAGAVAQAVAGLMDETFKHLAPEHICDVFKQTGGDTDGMWSALGQPTIDCIAAGARTLAMLWSSLWSEAGAAAPAAVAVDRDALRSLYEDPKFAPSMYLTELAGDASPTRKSAARRRAPAKRSSSRGKSGSGTSR